MREVSYGSIVVSYRPYKADPNISSLAVGGDIIQCIYDVITPTSNLPTIKMLCNSVLSTPEVKFFTLDISNFCLVTPMEQPEYMRPPIKIIPQEIINKYNLNDIVEDVWVYVKIVKGMYVLPQAGKIANNIL